MAIAAAIKLSPAAALRLLNPRLLPSFGSVLRRFFNLIPSNLPLFRANPSTEATACNFLLLRRFYSSFSPPPALWFWCCCFSSHHPVPVPPLHLTRLPGKRRRLLHPVAVSDDWRGAFQTGEESPPYRRRSPGDRWVAIPQLSLGTT